jgi:Holliday junction resolvase RusA-like endonuclease
MVGRPHQQKPDLDNLLKALVDACYQEDKGIWNYGELKKLWDYKGSIIIE